ncbi:replication factor A protein 3, putative [Plasmodium gallinaceum]|uniref:Replication factor A protein 3, putative n=1 Tax=Plasmodium gallinaceum TaxID=5849 RepID=A0A1J1GQC3_PLAGA|nr:replication factor A protein 3, putative [Plasmodium gallinaceum]CRG94616.1 replication factor A protein 3, putative [Plasmodium gallinaceum]
MEQYIAPRVNKKYLKNFFNKNVRIVGKILKKDGNELILQTPDNGEIKCFLNENQMVDSLDKYIEVLGRVNEDETLSDIVYIQNGGNNINMNELNNLINMTFLEEFEEIF